MYFLHLQRHCVEFEKKIHFFLIQNVDQHTLKLKYPLPPDAPVCASSEAQMIWVGRGEHTKLHCLVLGSPQVRYGMVLVLRGKHIKLHCLVLASPQVWYGMVWYGTVWVGRREHTKLYCLVLASPQVWYSMVWYGMVGEVRAHQTTLPCAG